MFISKKLKQAYKNETNSTRALNGFRHKFVDPISHGLSAFLVIGLTLALSSCEQL